jgi:hypothetical protein
MHTVKPKGSSLEMHVPSKGHYGFHSFPVVDAGHAKYNLHRRSYSKYITSTSMTTKKIHINFQLMNMVIHG